MLGFPESRGRDSFRKKSSRSPDNPRANSPTANPRVKKYPCKLFANGACGYGDRCRFSHDYKSAAAVSQINERATRSANSPAPNDE